MGLLLISLLACGDPEAPPPGLQVAVDPITGLDAAALEPGEDLKPVALEVEQSALTEANSVQLSGELVCPGQKGPFILHLFPPPPAEGDQEPTAKPPGPVTGLDLAQAGPFSLRAPKQGTGVLMGFRDADNDRMPAPGQPLMFAGDTGPTPLDLTQDQAGLTMTCSAPLKIGPQADHEPLDP